MIDTKQKSPMASVDSDRRYSCSICQKTFSTKKGVSVHANVHEGRGGPPYRCSTCDRKYSRQEQLARHEKFHEEGYRENRYRCLVCSRKCDSSGSLTKHMRSHTGERPYTCDQCGKAFALRGTLKYHINSHRNREPTPCDLCSFVASTRYGLKSHMSSHAGLKVACDKLVAGAGRNLFSNSVDAANIVARVECGTISNIAAVKNKAKTLKAKGLNSEQVKFSANLASVSNKEKDFSCSKCEKKFNSRSGFEAHMLIYHEDCVEQQFSCSSCEEKFVDSESLEKHKSCHSSASECSFVCDKCDTKFLSSQHLRDHMLQHQQQLSSSKQPFNHQHTLRQRKSSKLNSHKQKWTPSRQSSKDLMMPYACAICHHRYEREKALQNHKLTKHRAALVYECSLCLKRFFTDIELSDHLRAKHEMVERPYVCCECGRNFTAPSTFMQHWKSHLYVKHECKICGERFQNDISLSRHVISHGIFLCVPCNEMFPSKEAWLQHEQLPSCMARRHVCQTCRFKCRSKPELASHVRRHTGEKPFACDRCGKKYRERSQLWTHIRTHTGERFECDECGKTFGEKTTLANHKRLHTGLGFTCTHCQKMFTTVGKLKRHRSTHRNKKMLKTFSCLVCKKKFLEAWKLSRHELTHGMKKGNDANGNHANDSYAKNSKTNKGIVSNGNACDSGNTSESVSRQDLKPSFFDRNVDCPVEENSSDDCDTDIKMEPNDFTGYAV